MNGIKKSFKKITPAYIAKTALLAAISYILYMFVKFPLPFMFPSFLEMQFSELPALLAGFGVGPLSGCLVIIIKCALKLPFSTTAMVGELMDCIIGLSVVIPASIFYSKLKTKKSALIGVIIGVSIATVFSMLFNRFVAIPFYVKLFFNGNFDAVVGICATLYKGVNKTNFYLYYIFLGVLPFNLLRLSIVGLITFLTYKKLSKILHWEVASKKKKKPSEVENNCQTEEKDI